MATKKDPTITTTTGGPEYPDGTHPVRPPSETSYSPDRFEYKDNPDKPDPSTVAQVLVDPLDQ